MQTPANDDTPSVQRGEPPVDQERGQREVRERALAAFLTLERMDKAKVLSVLQSNGLGLEDWALALRDAPEALVQNVFRVLSPNAVTRLEVAAQKPVSSASIGPARRKIGAKILELGLAEEMAEASSLTAVGDAGRVNGAAALADYDVPTYEPLPFQLNANGEVEATGVIPNDDDAYVNFTVVDGKVFLENAGTFGSRCATVGEIEQVLKVLKAGLDENRGVLSGLEGGKIIFVPYTAAQAGIRANDRAQYEWLSPQAFAVDEEGAVHAQGNLNAASGRCRFFVLGGRVFVQEGETKKRPATAGEQELVLEILRERSGSMPQDALVLEGGKICYIPPEFVEEESGADSVEGVTANTGMLVGVVTSDHAVVDGVPVDDAQQAAIRRMALRRLKAAGTAEAKMHVLAILLDVYPVDAVVGLIPVVGDGAMLALALSYTLAQAVKAKLGFVRTGKIVGYHLVDFFAGLVAEAGTPIFATIVDFFIKANSWSASEFKAHLSEVMAKAKERGVSDEEIQAALCEAEVLKAKWDQKSAKMRALREKVKEKGLHAIASGAVRGGRGSGKDSGEGGHAKGAPETKPPKAGSGH